ncbi:hypothetical protein OPV22_013421 [Ensete ventricosum]|uniref:Uncharacterized protein n=1 Tax=Ensete ventricosum TaxID=4639 RepID=A0AAV8QZC3_ENSVE|nr:hypothetical protein OPV22_013421 [Ensete ventricosum]
MRMVTRFLFWAEEEESSYRGIGKQWGSYPPDLVLSSKGKVAEGTLRKRTQPLRADGIGRSARITGKRSSRISGQGIQWSAGLMDGSLSPLHVSTTTYYTPPEKPLA